jgi:protein NUD1
LSPALLANHAKLHDRLSRILDDKAAGQDRKQQRFPSAATNITTIAPSDISPVPEQIGNMHFDKTTLRWVKRAGEESDDPFRDIESVGRSKSNEQRAEGLSISLEESAQRVIEALTGELDYASNLSSDDEAQRDEEAEAETGTVQFRPGGMLSVPPPESFSTPVGARLVPQSRSAVPTPIRSAMKATTPVVVVHGPEPGSSTGKPRSVSFSDGRRSGRIRGLHQSADDEDTSNSQDAQPRSQFEEKRSLQPSFRTKRIADLLDDLDGETSRDDEEDQTPCKSSSQQRSMVGSLLSVAGSGAGSAPLSGLSVASRSAIGRSTRARDRDATFLTECSFGVAHDRLLQCITDVQPFEPHWEELGSIDLSGKGLDSLARLKEFMPKLEELIMFVPVETGRVCRY